MRKQADAEQERTKFGYRDFTQLTSKLPVRRIIFWNVISPNSIQLRTIFLIILFAGLTKWWWEQWLFPIELKYSFPDTLPQTAITKEGHRELFMVVKETLNNIAKHANATAVFFKLEITSQHLLLSIKDNGIGFNDENKKGNGLRNMKSRLEAIGGTFNIISEKDLGTEICVTVPLQKIVK